MSNNKYTKTAIILHWLIALGIFAMFGLGWYMTELPKEAPKQMAYDLFNWGIYTWQLTEEASPRSFYFNLHKSIGITILGLVVIRILWRMTHQPPALLTSYKEWERKLSTGAHHLLYLLMFAMPATGLIMAMSGKYGVKWFGLDFLAGSDNKVIREFFAGAHEAIGALFLLIIVLHIVGALKHKLIDKDTTMDRMSFK